MPSEDKYMTVEEVAAYLGYEKQTIYNKVHTNAIPFPKIGPKTVRFKKAEVDAWIERKDKQKYKVEQAIEKAQEIYKELGSDPERAAVIVQIATLLLAHDAIK